MYTIPACAARWAAVRTCAVLIALVEESSSSSGTAYSISSKRVSALTLPAAANSTMSWPEPGAPEPGVTPRQGAGPRLGRRARTEHTHTA